VRNNEAIFPLGMRRRATMTREGLTARKAMTARGNITTILPFTAENDRICAHRLQCSIQDAHILRAIRRYTWCGDKAALGTPMSSFRDISRSSCSFDDDILCVYLRCSLKCTLRIYSSSNIALALPAISPVCQWHLLNTCSI
jgi:hypothetical protein